MRIRRLVASALKEVVLIGLVDGNRWKDSISVDNTSEITEEEFKRISDGNFTPIEDNR